MNIAQSQSQAQTAVQPLTLSILIPFFRDDPSDLIRDLLEQMQTCPDTELLLYDDGTGQSELTNRLAHLISSSRARLITAEQNHGRAYARNHLFSQSKGEWVLFLDADMRPVGPHFLSDYLSLIKNPRPDITPPDIIFGGFQVPDHTSDPERELHRQFSQSSDALSAEDRQKFGPQYVCSSNLCVRKSVLITEPFDDSFSGWGWEDSEWAARAARQYSLYHADIPALHLGLETTDTLLNRFQNSGVNYQKFTQRHPDVAQNLNLYNGVKFLQKWPAHALSRPALKWAVKTHILPIRLRLLALKLWRASWYAEVL